MSLNRYTAIGRMTKAPDKRIANNKSVVTFTLAINRNFETADGQSADFINCVCWGKLADNVDLYCEKGSQVCIEARMQSRSYDNAQGQKVYVVEAICESVQFLDKKKEQTQTQAASYQQPMTQPTYQAQSTARTPAQQDFYNQHGFDISDDDIQF